MENTKVSTSEVLQDEKTFNRNKWFFTTTGIGRDMLYTLVSTYFLQYVQFGLTLTVAQFTTLSLLIGILGRVWDGINDPMMGAIIDGTHFKWGKFKPWILIGAIADSVLTIVLFNLRSVTGWAYVGIICCVYLLWEAAFTMNDIGYWSMIPSLSRTKERRDKLTSLTVFFAGIGTIAMTGIVTLLSPGHALLCYTVCSIIACLGVIIGQTITAIFVKEGPREDNPLEKISFKRMVVTIFKNKQLLWMSLAQLCSSAATGILLGLIYNLYYLEVGYNGDIFYFVVVYAVCNTLLQLLYPKLADKFGRKKLQLVSFFFMALGYLGMALMGWFKFFPMTIVTICIFALLIFAGNTLFYTAEVINTNNCVEYNEYMTGERDEAVVTTMRPLIVKFGDAIKYLVVTLTISLSGLYAITNHISTIENQTSTFDNHIIQEFEGDELVSEIKDYVVIYKAFDEAHKNGTKVSLGELEHTAEVYGFSDEYLSEGYIESVGLMRLVKTDNNDNLVDYKQLSSDFDVDQFVEKGYKYQLLINYSDNSGNELFNAGNEVYASQAPKEENLGMRIALRVCTIVLPCLLMFACLMIQRKKFIIDEDYYDMMLTEIEKKKQAKNTIEVE